MNGSALTRWLDRAGTGNSMHSAHLTGCLRRSRRMYGNSPVLTDLDTLNQLLALARVSAEMVTGAFGDAGLHSGEASSVGPRQPKGVCVITIGNQLWQYSRERSSRPRYQKCAGIRW